MALASKPPAPPKVARRIWKTSGTLIRWLLIGSAWFMLGAIYLIYRSAASQQPPDPNNDPFRTFGIVAFVLVLLVAAYTLRRRFLRQLPGKVQHWLTSHVWFGGITILIVFLHENFQGITHDFSLLPERLTEAAYGTSALYALLLLVLSGLLGRLLDIRQARIIAAEAASNGVGIPRAVEERLLKLSLTLERLCAGKSPQFKSYCTQALQRGELPTHSWPDLAPSEGADFQRAVGVLNESARLANSLQRQQHAQLIMRVWRSIHIPLACIAFAVICYHAIFELLNIIIFHQ